MKNVLHVGMKKGEKKNALYVIMDFIFQIIIHTFVKNALSKIAKSAHLKMEMKFVWNVLILM